MDVRQEYIDKFLSENNNKKFSLKKAISIPTVQYLIFLVICALLPLLSKVGILSSSFVFAIGNTMVYAIMGIGFCLLMGYTGLASLGTAGFVGIGAYVAYYIIQISELPFGVAFVATIAVALVIGVMVGIISLRIEGIYLAILTLGLSEILRNTFVSLKPTIKIDMSKVRLFGTKVGEDGIYIVILIVFVLLLWLTSNLIKSPTGRAMLSVKNSTSLAKAMGVNVMKYRTMAFVISTIFAAIAGLLYMMYLRTITTSTSTLLSMTTSLNILGAVVIGGAESLWGTAFGIFIIYGLQATVLSKIPLFVENPALITMITGLLIILIVMFFPGGIAQMVNNAKHNIKMRKLKNNTERRIDEYGKF